jgi:uncharacterized RDD family membrane protein YckC
MWRCASMGVSASYLRALWVCSLTLDDFLRCRHNDLRETRVTQPEWYYAVNGNQMGPISEHKLLQKRASGEIGDAVLVWTQSLDDWVPMGSVSALASPAEALPDASSAGSVSAISEPSRSGIRLQYAGFWMRVVAALVDVTVLLAVGYVIAGMVTAFYTGSEQGSKTLFIIVSILVRWLYFAKMESSDYGATLGKLAVGLKVTDLEGAPIPFRTATVRHFGKELSSLTLGAGYVMVAFTERKQGLHDMLAGCLVVRR